MIFHRFEICLDTRAVFECRACENFLRLSRPPLPTYMRVPFLRRDFDFPPTDRRTNRVITRGHNEKGDQRRFRYCLSNTTYIYVSGILTRRHLYNETRRINKHYKIIPRATISLPAIYRARACVCVSLVVLSLRSGPADARRPEGR